MCEVKVGFFGPKLVLLWLVVPVFVFSSSFNDERERDNKRDRPRGDLLAGDVISSFSSSLLLVIVVVSKVTSGDLLRSRDVFRHIFGGVLLKNIDGVVFWGWG